MKGKYARDNTKLMCDIGEISGLFADSTSLESFLQSIVEMIAEHMKSEVCSIYLYYPDKEELVLKANVGLNTGSIGNIKLKLGEGLTGWALKELRPICERHASQSAHFRHFPGIGEERFESFLVVPIIRGTSRIGALVIQNTEKDYFNDDDIAALRVIASQLANTIEMTRLILSFEEKRDVKQEKVTQANISLVKGIVGSPGFAYAEVVVWDEGRSLTSYVQGKKIEHFTLEDFYKAVELTERELQSVQKQIEEKLSDVASLIFTAQILMLKDKNFIEAIVELIKRGMNPSFAIIQVVESYMEKFRSLPNSYLQEKSHDVLDIGRRLLENLMHIKNSVMDVKDKVLIASELVPSDVLKLSSLNIKGIILLTGGSNSHVAILAQSLEIPLIVADEPGLLSLPSRSLILLDAEQGNIYINPSLQIVEPFKNRNAGLELTRLKDAMTPTTETRDGTRVKLLANINLLGEIKNALNFKAEGIGLYRTEFPFIVRNDFPSEEEQFVIYKKLVLGMENKEITFRTLDIGGDKVLSYYEQHHKEKNPYLGMRSIRFSLKHMDIFAQQLRAILRAGLGADIRIMFPMISSLDEFLEAKGFVLKCIKTLKAENVPCHHLPKIGLMIELPAVLEVIDELAQEADFFSIGTNDFIQYMLAVDRTNEKVADLYLPHHPSVLRALKRIVEAAQRHGKEVSICGDMAREERYIKYLLGIGVRILSINPKYLPKVQRSIKDIDLREAEELTRLLLSKSRLSEIKELIDRG